MLSSGASLLADSNPSSRRHSAARFSPNSELCEHVAHGPGHADVIALRVIDTALPQPVGHLYVADELGDGLLAHALRDPDDRFDHKLVGGVGDEAPNEVAVDLEVVEREVLEVVERAEACSKVVQGELAAAVPQLVRESLRLLDVSDRRRLCQLEDETRGIDAGVAQCAIDDLDELRVAD